MVSAAASSRLYLVLPAKLTAIFVNGLTRVLTEWEPACILLSDDASEAEPGLVPRLREVTAAREVALLVANDPERAEAIGADGVHLPPDVARFEEARGRLGQRAIIGVGCIESRHDAMVMAELGADYVGFGPGPGDRQAELIAWWSEIFVVPSVAFDVETPEAAERLLGLGVDFAAPSPRLWQGEAALERIGAVAAALRRGRSAA